MSRGVKNNNPGNIRRSATQYKGEVVPSQDGTFKQFENMAWGYRAIFVLLHTYRIRHGLDTIAQMIERYAPPTENDTQRYVSFVAFRSGIGSGEKLDTLSGEVMRPIVAAISRMENGVEPVQDEIARGWELFVKYMP